jgi:hypothetical protein
MVALASTAEGRIYQVFDPTGRAIGQVVEPREEPVVGHGEGTVLLMRAVRRVGR